MFDLIVTSPFEAYAKGQRISNDVEISKALDAYPHNVIRVARLATQSQPKPAAPAAS